MARAASYGDLRGEGETLRTRLERVIPDGPPVETLIREVRVWQLRCAVAVAIRSPRLVSEFRSRAGDLQELTGHGWVPSPGWQSALAQLISSWLGAINWAEGPDG
ncbi:MAG: hypothetical protein ACRDGI_07620 [Candidatus Limnocylindrales bacterium]